MSPDVTAVLAIYGVIVSTTSLAWTIRTGMRDRARLRLTLVLGEIIGGGQPRRTQLMLSIVNVGRRPITVSKWGGSYRRSKDMPHFFIVPRGLPKELKESEEHQEFTDQFVDVASKGIRDVWAYDSTGRQWKVPRKQVARVEKEIQEFLAKSSPPEP